MQALRALVGHRVRWTSPFGPDVEGVLVAVDDWGVHVATVDGEVKLSLSLSYAVIQQVSVAS